MRATHVVRATITCRGCGALNEITASDIPATQEIFCSRCAVSLGKWRELRQSRTPEADEPTPA